MTAMALPHVAPDPSSARLRAAGEVRAWMGRLRLRQVAIARLLGLSQASVSARLSGQAAFTLDELETLAAQFGIDVADLIPRREQVGQPANPQASGGVGGPRNANPPFAPPRVIRHLALVS